MLLEEVDLLIKPQSRKLQADALQKLRGLHLIKEKYHSKTLVLSPTFKMSIRNVLTGEDVSSSFGVPCDTDDKHKVDIKFLDTHAIQKWESILHFMVGTFHDKLPSDGVISLLRHSELMEGRSPRDMVITSKGFQFLLQDVNAQIWALLLQYLNMASNLQMDPVDVLNFIFMLGSLELGKDYSLAALSDTQVKMLEDLRDFGIVYQRKSSSRRFYPTRLATTLTSDSAALRSASASMDIATHGSSESAAPGFSSGETGGFIILETNYRLYAYTESPLQIAVLNLFAHLKARFPNMVTGSLSRDSVRQALRNGISADQIIMYLSVHAHPQMRKNDPVLPTTVVDQIKLWQLEMDRVKATEGYLYSNFRTPQEYQMVVDYAQELGVLEWVNASKKKFFISREGNSQVVDFINRNMQL